MRVFSDGALDGVEGFGSAVGHGICVGDERWMCPGKCGLFACATNKETEKIFVGRNKAECRSSRMNEMDRAETSKVCSRVATKAKWL